MRSLDDIRQRAWEVRAECLADGRRLLDGIKALIERHGISLAPVQSSALEGGDAELQPPALLYDERFNANPARLAYVLAHELGHLEFHPRVQRRTYRANPIAAAIYLRQQEVGAVATYSHRLPEETEAITFANEVTCPSREVFDRWRQRPGETVASLAAHGAVPVELVAVQLVEGLYREALGSAPSAATPTRGPSEPNPGQKEAIRHLDGPALVVAGPGTGKTWTLVEHAVHTLQATDAVGDNLLVLTFSNEAAEELRVRVGSALDGIPNERVAVFTFHGFGYYLIRLFHKELGFKAPPAVLDEAGQAELLLEAFAQSHADAIFNLKDPEGAAATAAEHINYLKQRLQTPEWLREMIDTLAANGPIRTEAEQRALADLWEVYERMKRERGRVDFADLIAVPVAHLRTSPNARKLVRNQFQRVLIDEYQDVSLATGTLVRTLCLSDDGSVAVPPWVVGDPFQGIYAFLGADTRNVTEFADVFDAAEIGLVQSYRSARPITEAANTLAALMNDQDEDTPEHPLLPAPSVEPFGDLPVRVFSAPTDAAEHQGVADLVADWLADPDIEPDDIAVLARRNVDVREIAKALAARGHATTTSGIVTAEGAAGDLVAALTLVDDPASALPRLAMALGSESLSLDERNETIAQALAHLAVENPLSSFVPEGKGGQLADELRAAYASAAEQAYSADAFSSAVTFLFDSTPYLRRILDARDETADPVEAAEAALSLVELATAFGHAAAYRFSHDRTPPREARLGFASHFRRTLARSTPSAVAPRRTPGLIRVMTCHASKGLEFPLVVVAGQRLPGSFRRLSWLPPEPSLGGQDQADALLYVGVTRAERAVAVSYSERATTTGRLSRLPGVLKAWIDSGLVAVESWPSVDHADKSIEIEPLWGLPAQRRVRARAFSKPKDNCSIRGYVQDELGLSFPRPEPGLYGVFVGRMRRLVSALFADSHRDGTPLTEEEALARLDEVWPVPAFEDHPLAPFYDAVARRVATSWSGALDRSVLTLPTDPVSLDLDAVRREAGVELVTGLAAHGRDMEGRPTGVVLHLKSLKSALLKGKDEVGWGAKSTEVQRTRPELAFLRSYFEATEGEPFQVFLYSVENGKLYRFAWPTGGHARHYTIELDRVGERLRHLAGARYVHEINAGQCERCGVRIACPYWTGASGDLRAFR